jgi:hypothetical protein
VLLNTESEASSVGEIGLSQLSIFDFKSSFENLICFITSDSNVNGNFLVSFDTEASNSESGSGWDWLLSS